MRAQSLLAFLPLLAVAGCGPSEPGAATASSPAAEAASPPASTPSGNPPPAPATSIPATPERRTPAAAPNLKPLAGMWRGPRNEDGSTPTIWIAENGIIQLESGGFTCTGKATPLADKYDLDFDFHRCITRLPPAWGTLSADGQTMTITSGKDREKWRLMERPR